MPWKSEQSGGGGGTTDTTARTQASAASAKISKIYKVPGDSVPAKSTVFILLSDGSVGQYTNPTAASINVPATATDVNILAAGFTQPATSIDPKQIDALIQQNRSAWRADAIIDFTANEPAKNAANLGKIYLNSKTGAGSITTGDTFHQDDLYYLAADLTWNEYQGKESDTLTIGVKDYKFIGGTWVEQVKTSSDLAKVVKKAGDVVEAGSEVFIIMDDGTSVNYKAPATDTTVPANPTNANVLAAGFLGIAAKENHLHSILANANTLGSSDTIFKVSGGKLWKNKIASPDITLDTSSPTWGDDWVEAITPSTGVTYVAVADNDTLVAKQFSVGSPALNVVVHTTAPAPSANSWFSVINTGAGIVDVGGTQIIGPGALEYAASKDGLSWVLTSREGVVVPATEKTSRAFTQTAHGFKVGQPIYHNGTQFALADGTTEEKSEVLGVVSSVPDANSFELCSEGYITGIVQTGLTPGVVFLNGTPGDLTITAPTTGFQKVVMILDTATSGWVVHRPGFDLDGTPPATVQNFYNSGTFDANSLSGLSGVLVSGVSGCTTANFPLGLAAPAAFYAHYEGSATDGLATLQVFGSPASSRGLWYRPRVGGTWDSWNRESGANNWEFTQNPATPGETYTLISGSVAINDGDILLLPVATDPASVRAAPVTTWDKVGTIALSVAATSAGWTIEGSQPTTGTQVIECIPDRFYKIWKIRKAEGAPLLTTIRPTNTAEDTKAVSEKAIATALAAINVTGEMVTPFNALFSGLPALPADTSSQVKYSTILTEDDIGTGDKDNPQYPAGLYLSGNAAADGWTFGASLGSKILKLVNDWLEATHLEHKTPGLVTFEQIMLAVNSATKFLPKADKADATAITAGTVDKWIDAKALKDHTDLKTHVPDPAALADGRTLVVSNKAWVDAAPIQQSDVIWSTGAPSAANTTHKVWVDTSVANWPVYYRAATTDTWPATKTGDLIDNLVVLSQAQVEDKASTVFGTVSGQRLYQAIIKTIPPMVGATATTAGVAGTVPDSLAGDQNKYLMASGSWGGLVPCPGWAANEQVTIGYQRYNVFPDTARCYLVSPVASGTRTTGASLDVTELGKWAYLAQDYIAPFTANMPVPKGYRIFQNGVQYQATSTHLTAATFDATERAKWAPISTSAGFIPAYSGGVLVSPNEFRRIGVGSSTVSVEMYSNATTNRTTPATFDVTEAANWTYFGQSAIGTYTLGVLYVTGYKILDPATGIWEATSNRISASSTFDTAEKAAGWKNISAIYNQGTLHDLGASTVTALTAVNSGQEAHFEGGPGYSLNANNANDGNVFPLLNTSGVDQNKFTFSGFTGASLRSGGNETTITSPFNIPKGLKFLASVTVNGGNRFLNVVQLGGSVSGSVTCQSGSHAFSNTGTGLSAVFSVTFPQPFVNIPTVELTYQWNYNASTNGGALSPPLLVEGISTTGFSYRINGNRNTLDRVLWTAVDPQSTIQAGNQVLTPRAITGSVTSVGYDGVELPYKIPLAAGLVLDTVSLNGTATTNFDANTGIVRITPNGAPIAVTHTVKAGATYHGLQRAIFSTTELALTASLQTYTLPAPLMEGDLLEVQHQYNGSASERQSVWVRVQAGSTQRNFPWVDAANNVHYWVFPATLDATFQVRQSTTSSSPRILSVKVWRDAANGYCIPNGYSVGRTYNLTVNGGTNGTFSGFEGIGPQPFILTGMTANQEVDAFPTVAGVTLLNRQAGLFTVNRALNGGDLALTGITFRNLGVKSKYFGTAIDQAGNTGHVFTQRYATGTGITTADSSTFTLTGGIYRVRYGVIRTKGALAWSARALFVNGGEVTSIYAGDDGGNWPGGGDLEWIVDATSASQTVQMRRTANNNNGNVDCWFSIEREEGYAVPEGYVTRDACVLTAASGTFSSGTTTANIPTNTGQYVGFTVPNGQVLQGVTSNNANVIAGAVDPRAGTVFVTVNNGAAAATLTPTFSAVTAIKGLAQANAGVAVNIGSIRIQMPTGGNRSFQVQSNTGASLTLQVQSVHHAGGSGTGLVNITATTGTWTYFSPGWNFTNQGEWQNLLINDQTNGRWYNVRAEVGAAYNNCTYSWFEIV